MAASVVDDHHVVGQLLGLLEVVRGEHDGDTGVPQACDQVPHGEARLRVEPGGRLVEEDQLGPADDGQGDAEPLPLATGEAAGGGAGHVPRPRTASRSPTGWGWA